MSTEIIENDVPTEYVVFLDSLKKAEGGYIHRNQGESDITTGYGIYKAVHPTAEVFNYIDSLAKTLNIYGDSSSWTKIEIDKINKILNVNTERYLTYLFYNKYLAGAHLNLFTPQMIPVMVNLYTNSTKGAWMSIQEGLRDLHADGILDLHKSDLSTVDGKYGGKTKRALVMFKNIKTTTDYEKDLLNIIFRKSVLLAMKTYYTKLVTARPDKFLKFAKGWDNRIEKLEHE